MKLIYQHNPQHHFKLLLVYINQHLIAPLYHSGNIYLLPTSIYNRYYNGNSYLSIYLSTYLSIYLPTYLIYLPIYLSIYLSNLHTKYIYTYYLPTSSFNISQDFATAKAPCNSPVATPSPITASPQQSDQRTSWACNLDQRR